MFKIYFYNPADGLNLLYSPQTGASGILLESGIQLQFKGTQVMSLKLLPNNPFYNRFSGPLDELIIEEYENIIFRGRLLGIQEVYEADGTKYKKITFEGIENSFLDLCITSSFNPASSSVTDIIKAIIKEYDPVAGAPYKHNIYFVPNTLSNTLDGQSPSEYTDQIGSSHKEIIDSIFKSKNHYLRLNHFKAQDNTVYSELEVAVQYDDQATPINLIYGRHIKSVSIDTTFDRLKNDVKIVGEGGLSSVVTDPSGISESGRFQFYKEDTRYSLSSSLDAYASEVLDRYKTPLVNITAEFIDYDYLKSNQEPMVLKLGDMIKIVNRDYNQIAEGFISEISYSLFDPHQKKLIIGVNKENLFKESDV